MELAGLSVREPSIIINPVGNIAVLLGLQNHQTALYGVYRTGIDLYEITLFHRDFPDQLSPSFLLNHFLQLLPGTCIVSHHKRRSLRTVQDIPAFRLSQRAVFILPGISIIRMHLDAQIILCVNNLYEERKTVQIAVSEQSRLLLPQLRKRFPLISAFSHHTVSVWMRTDGPAFPGVAPGNLISELICKLPPSPDHLLKYRL